MRPSARRVKAPVTHHVYRGYLIRWSVFTLDKPSNRIWVEKDNAFICWADSVDAAKLSIDELIPFIPGVFL